MTRVVSKRASDLRLKAIGKFNHQKKSRFAVAKTDSYDPSRETFYDSEVDPLCQTKLNQPVDQENEWEENKSVIEDPRVSRFSHSKLLLVEKNLLLLTILLLFFSIIGIEVTSYSIEQETISDQLMKTMSIATIVLILLLFVRKILVLQLEIDQKKIYVRSQKDKIFTTLAVFLSDKDLIIEFGLEVIVAIIHPNTFTKNMSYSLYHTEYDINLTYRINDLLSVLMILKIYIILRAIVALTIFATPRASRLCYQNRFEHSFFYSIKCIQQEYPITSILFMFLICLVLFSYGFRVTEGNLSYINPIPPNGYQYMLNCYWFSFITMGTIGYGQYVPKTVIARILAGTLAIIGVLLNSLLIFALTEYLKMKGSQIRSHTANIRLSKHKKLNGDAALAVIEMIKISNLLSSNSLDPLVARKLKPSFTQLKRYVQMAKSEQRQIKATIPAQNISEEMIKSFGLIKDNFKQICFKQRSIKHSLQQIEKHNSCKRSQFRQSFMKQVKDILNKFR